MIANTHSQDETIIVSRRNIAPKILLWLALAGGLGYWLLPTFSQWYSSIPTVSRANLTIATVVRGELVRDVAVSGLSVAANAPQLYSTEMGQITLLAKPGETVAKNQIVAQLVSPELGALIKQQQSTLEQLSVQNQRSFLTDKEAQLELESKMNTAQANVNVAKRENQRAALAFEKKIISEVDWLKSQDTLADARLFYQHAQKRVELAKERLKFEKQHRDFLVEKQQLILDELNRRQQALGIQAPVAGVVGNWLVAQKNTIAANTAVMTIVDLSAYEAQLKVPEFYADDLGLGLTVAMQIAGVEVSGEIIAISPEVKANQVTVSVKLVAKENMQLRQNQRINARIQFEQKENVLMIKRGAFAGSQAGQFAYKLISDNQAQQITITTGLTSVDFVELTAGVKEGDQLIISDYQDFGTASQVNIND